MNWGFLVYCCLLFGGLVLEGVKHGQAKTGKHDVYTSSVSAIICITLLLWAMGWKV